MKVVLAVDPGKTTGVALIVWSGVQEDTPALEYAEELDEETFGPTISRLIQNWYSNDMFYIVCERFTITAQTVRNSQAPFSLEQIGVLKHIAREHSYPVDLITFEAPVNAKSMFPNEALKKIGTWHKGGEGHANDAIRHALLKLVKSGWNPKILLD